jgi:hypothetical protein
MSQAKHTSTPWVAEMGGRIKTANGRLIASAWFPRSMPDANEDRMDGESWLEASNRLKPESTAIELEMEINARLIAAAPEMLEALKDCRRALELANFTGELAIVDAAIAKAEGV